jgi:hypothetical protein
VAGDPNHPRLPQPPAVVPRNGAGSAPVRPLAQDAFGREIAAPADSGTEILPVAGGSSTSREAATESIGRRAGALSDELDFPDFVASLVHGTFDAIVDSAIRQMESFADMVAAVAKPIDQFTQENVTLNQARDWLVEQYPRDLMLARESGSTRVVPRGKPDGEGEDDAAASPAWLSEFGSSGEELTPELVEEKLVPAARERVARNRLQTLATMVLLGMNRVIVKDGTIGARLRFRAAAADHAKVDYAVSDDAGAGAEWGRRGSRTFALPSTKVSTVGVNVQADSELKAELFGDVKINFASETVPLDRFVDEARRTLLERHARPLAGVSGRPAEPAVRPVAPGGEVAAAPPQLAPAGAAAPPPPPPPSGGRP